jgi:hypothetical protein
MGIFTTAVCVRYSATGTCTATSNTIANIDPTAPAYLTDIIDKVGTPTAITATQNPQNLLDRGGSSPFPGTRGAMRVSSGWAARRMDVAGAIAYWHVALRMGALPRCGACGRSAEPRRRRRFCPDARDHAGSPSGVASVCSDLLCSGAAGVGAWLAGDRVFVMRRSVALWNFFFLDIVLQTR